MAISSGRAIMGGTGCVFLNMGPRGVTSILAPLTSVLGRERSHFVLIAVTTNLGVSHFGRVLNTGLPVVHVVPGAPISINRNVVLCTAYPTVASRRMARFRDSLGFTKGLSEVPRSLVSTNSIVSNYNPTFICAFTRDLRGTNIGYNLDRRGTVLCTTRALGNTTRLLLRDNRAPSTLHIGIYDPGNSAVRNIRILGGSRFRGVISSAIGTSFEQAVRLKRWGEPRIENCTEGRLVSLWTAFRCIVSWLQLLPGGGTRE